jgi:hypothetical protein
MIKFNIQKIYTNNSNKSSSIKMCTANNSNDIKTNKKKFNSPSASNIKNFSISKFESLAIINDLKELNDEENIIIFYFIYIKGLNFSTISRILLRDFKRNFSYLIIKKGTKKKYKIDIVIRENFSIS